MSQHKSFTKNTTSTSKHKKVLKRFERIDLLKKRGLWKTNSSIFGLPKTKPEN